MHAVILAGGKGVRLAPYTARTPKVLLPLDGVPVIERLLLQLRDENITRCTVVTGHLAEEVTSYLGSGARWGMQLQFLRESRPLNTAGCLGQLRPSDPFLLINGDIVTDFCFTDLITAHRQAECAASVAVCRYFVDIEYGVLQIDSDGRMIDLIEKPRFEYWLNMGIYCLNPGVCRLVEPGQPVSMPELLLRLSNAGEVIRAHPTDCYWRDIGRPADYLQARQDLEAASAQPITRQAA